MDGWAADQQGGRRDGAFLGDGKPGTVNGGRSRTYHLDGWADIFFSLRRCSAEVKQQGAVHETEAWQQAAARDGPAGLPQDDHDKDSDHDEAHRYQNQKSGELFSKTIMEMKRNKTAEEPKKQNAGARNRVALEEEDRVKLDRWMTEPVHKVRPVFPKTSPCCLFTMFSIYSLLGLPCHQFTILVRAIHYPCHPFPCHPLPMQSIDCTKHSHCDPFTIP